MSATSAPINPKAREFFLSLSTFFVAPSALAGQDGLPEALVTATGAAGSRRTPPASRRPIPAARGGPAWPATASRRQPRADLASSLPSFFLSFFLVHVQCSTFVEFTRILSGSQSGLTHVPASRRRRANPEEPRRSLSEVR